MIARSVVLIVRHRGGRFLRMDESDGRLFEVGDKKAEAKTSQVLREGLGVKATNTAAKNLMETLALQQQQAVQGAYNHLALQTWNQPTDDQLPQAVALSFLGNHEIGNLSHRYNAMLNPCMASNTGAMGSARRLGLLNEDRSNDFMKRLAGIGSKSRRNAEGINVNACNNATRKVMPASGSRSREEGSHANARDNAHGKAKSTSKCYEDGSHATPASSSCSHEDCSKYNIRKHAKGNAAPALESNSLVEGCHKCQKADKECHHCLLSEGQVQVGNQKGPGYEGGSHSNMKSLQPSDAGARISSTKGSTLGASPLASMSKVSLQQQTPLEIMASGATPDIVKKRSNEVTTPTCASIPASSSVSKLDKHQWGSYNTQLDQVSDQGKQNTSLNNVGDTLRNILPKGAGIGDFFLI